MTQARFKVVFAGPLVSFQDLGRIGHLRFGVSPSGPMDRFAHGAAQTMVGNRTNETAIEVSLGGLILECIEGETTFAAAGGGFSVICGAAQNEGWIAQRVLRGDKITLRAGSWGSWAYVAFAGQIEVDTWLGATATHSMSGFGAGALQAGMEFSVKDAEVRERREGQYTCPACAKPASDVHVVIGPQDQHFDPASVQLFTSQSYALTDAYDRMGVRLTGPTLSLLNALSIPSEPIVRGSVQVSGDGVPTVLLADHQTTGGYPKVATVVSRDVDRLTQLRAGDALRFRAISATKAVQYARDQSERDQKALAQIAEPRATLGEKLLNTNLIGGVVSAIKENP